MHFKNETDLNAAVRGILKGRGLQCVHVREADVPGPLDLVVWRGRFLVCWIELKLDDEEVRASQKEFIRHNESCSIVMRWRNVEQIMEFWFVGRKLEWPPYRMTWDQFVTWTGKLYDWAVEKQRLIEE